MKNHTDRFQWLCRAALLLLVDIVFINLSAFLSLVARYDFSIEQWRLSSFFPNHAYVFSAFTLLTILFFVPMKLYNSLWEFASVDELLHIILAVTLVALIQLAAILFGFVDLPLSFPLLNAMFLTALTTFSRFSYRFVRSLSHRYRRKSTRKRTMLIGAGSAGMLVLREFQASENSQNHVVCIIDDDPQKQGKYLHNVKIVGTRKDILRAAEVYCVEEIVFAIPVAATQVVRF
mgnify:FL=1